MISYLSSIICVYQCDIVNTSSISEWDRYEADEEGNAKTQFKFNTPYVIWILLICYLLE